MFRVGQRANGYRRDVPLVDRRGGSVAVGTSHDARRPDLRRPCKGVGVEISVPQHDPLQPGSFGGVLDRFELLGEAPLAHQILDGDRR